MFTHRTGCHNAPSRRYPGMDLPDAVPGLDVPGVPVMAIHFIQADTRKKALATLPITPCKMIKVDGGYAWFDTMTDYEIWRRNK